MCDVTEYIWRHITHIRQHCIADVADSCFDSVGWRQLVDWVTSVSVGDDQDLFRDGCKTNYKKRVHGINTVTHPGTVISLPDEVIKPDLRRQWMRFCNQKSFHIKHKSGICTKHFDAKFVKEGERKTLKWELDPVPSNYCPDIDLPPSSLPTLWTTRKPPIDRSSPDQLNDFQKNDEIKSLADFTDALCPPGYKLEVHEGKAAIFCKMEMSEQNIPKMTEGIVIDSKLHGKLYKRSMPIRLPQMVHKRRWLLRETKIYYRKLSGICKKLIFL